VTTIRLSSTAGARAPRSRRITRAKQARIFTTIYAALLGVITTLLGTAAADILTAINTGDTGARPLASNSLFAALVIFTFVLPAVAALQLRIERVRGER
jgi:hypothetical protein